MKTLRTSKNRKSPKPVSRKRLWKAFFRPVPLALPWYSWVCVRDLPGLQRVQGKRTPLPSPEVVFYGNLHLSEGELKSMTGLNAGKVSSLSPQKGYPRNS